MDIPSVVASILMIAAAGVVGAFLSARLRFLPLSAWFVVGGVLLAVTVETLHLDTGIRARNFKDLVFYVLLPVLIYEAAYAAPKIDMRRLLPTIILMASVGIILSAAVGGYLFWSTIPQASFTLLLALLVAVILSATDPLAVVGQLKATSAPQELRALLEGESLFNDAVAIVVFSFLLLAITTASSGGATVTGPLLALMQFSLLFFGGIAVGLLTGIACEWLRNHMHNNASATLLGLMAAYGSFYIAEHAVHVSGVMAVLSAGLWVGTRHEKSDIGELHDSQHRFWDALSYIFNMVVFVIMGLVVSANMFVNYWQEMLIGIAVMLIARAISVYVCSYFARAAMRQDIDSRYPPILVWGGLRGVISIALVLSLYGDVPHWHTIQAIVYGVVLFSIFVQASTSPLLMRKLKLIKG